jgi:hypothetical protein
MTTWRILVNLLKSMDLWVNGFALDKCQLFGGRQQYDTITRVAAKLFAAPAVIDAPIWCTYLST